MTDMANPSGFSELPDRPGHLIRRLHQIHVAIAGLLGIDRNNAADVIRRLDRRARFAHITENGRQLVDAVFPAMVEAQHRFVSPLSDDEFSQLMDLMEKLVVEKMRPAAPRGGSMTTVAMRKTGLVGANPLEAAG